MTHNTHPRTWHQVPWALVLFALVASMSARADGGRLMPMNAPAAYAQECASCHLAYPPGLLPARSWQRLMGGLDRHYGSDASLDAATVQQISGWLLANAGTYKRVAEAPPEDRITRSTWFVREHDEVAPSVWKLASVKSAANCAACHTQAAEGSYREREIRIPSK
jgi:cytochrome c553